MNIRDIKKIDMHAHANLYPDLAPGHPGVPSMTPITDKMLIDIYDKINVEVGVIQPIIDPVSMYALHTNEECKIMADRSGGRLLWALNISPYAAGNRADADMSYIFEHYLKLGAVACGEVTTNIYLDDPKMDNLLSHLERYDLATTIHMHTGFDGSYGVIDDLHLPRLEKMLKKHPDLKIIGHSPVFWTEISGDVTEETRTKYPPIPTPVKDGGAVVRLMREYPNLCCDISNDSGGNAIRRDREFTARFFEEFADQIFYACDICNEYSTFQYEVSDFLVEMVEDGYLSEENYIKIVRNNAAKALKRTDLLI